jgi:acyl-CoA dehydrogenase
MFCLARTRREGKPQAGISFLLLDMQSPGITVRPIITLAGEHEVNQVFFDQVRAPVANRLGEENDGWTVAKYLLEFERGGGGAPGLRVALERLIAMASAAPADGGGRLIEDPAFRLRLARLAIALEAVETTELRVLAAMGAGQPPGPVSSVMKIQTTELMQKLDELALDALGVYAPADQPEARAPNANVAFAGPEAGLTTTARYLNDRAGSIYGGSNEIQRDIIARLILGL